MKIKLDFITNSSSTAFFFIFKGDKNSLLDLIVKHSKIFNIDLSEEDWEEKMYCDYMFVIDSINKCLQSKEIKIKKISDLIEQYKNNIEEVEKCIRKESSNNTIISFYTELKNEYLSKLEKIETCEKLGFTNLLTYYSDYSYNILPQLVKKGIKVDFAFIDGDHKYEPCLADLRSLNGVPIIILHDATAPLVQQAIIHFIESSDILYDCLFLDTYPVDKERLIMNILGFCILIRRGVK